MGRKENHKKWKEANPEKYRESCRKSYLKYRKANKDQVNARSRAWKKANPEKTKAWTKANLRTLCNNSKKHRAKIYELVSKIKTNMGCQNPNCCWNGEFLGCDLDFHHKDPTQKTGSIAVMLAGSKERLIKEINKCTVLCAICHRRTHEGTLDCSSFLLCEISSL